MRKALLVAMVLAGSCSVAHAGPFGRSVTRSSERVCVNGECGEQTTIRQRTVARSTGTAQGVAELQAQDCRCRHYGGNTSYEGVGMGMTPESALNNCCGRGRTVVDQGVAQGRDGRWYACRRYSR